MLPTEETTHAKLLPTEETTHANLLLTEEKPLANLLPSEEMSLTTLLPSEENLENKEKNNFSILVKKFHFRKGENISNNLSIHK